MVIINTLNLKIPAMKGNRYYAYFLSYLLPFTEISILSI